MRSSVRILKSYKCRVRGFTAAWCSRQEWRRLQQRTDTGKVIVSGPLSHDAVTVGVGLSFGPGSRHWFNAVNDGDVGVFMPGDAQEAFYTEGSLYIAATLSVEQLEKPVARRGLAVSPKLMLATGLHSSPISARKIAGLRRQVARIHRTTSQVSTMDVSSDSACYGSSSNAMRESH